MKSKLFFLSLFIFLGTFSKAQSILNVKELKPEKEYENILPRKLFGDEKVSSFVIWIKKEVKPHKHVFHSEHVYVLKGKGTMRLAGKEYQVKKGDFMFIPEGTPHALIVKKTMQVISIQAPAFKGKDRVLLGKEGKNQ